MRARVYLDWNATAPLRVEAKTAMLRAMDALGNPSSVHSEGRAAKAILETARRQVAVATGAMSGDVVFTSGATEAAGLALAGRGIVASATEHPCVLAWVEVGAGEASQTALQLANNETGVIAELPDGLAFTDAVQGFGKIAFAFDWLVLVWQQYRGTRSVDQRALAHCWSNLVSNFQLWSKAVGKNLVGVRGRRI